MSEEFVIDAATNQDVDAVATDRPGSLDEALGGDGAFLSEIEDHLGSGDPSAGSTPVGSDVPSVSTLALNELVAQDGGPSSMRDLRLLADISVQVTVEFGRAKLPLRQLLSLTRGAVLELHRTPEQPVDVLVNETLIARGEVVLVGEEFGVRITEIVNPNHPNHGFVQPAASEAATDDLTALGDAPDPSDAGFEPGDAGMTEDEGDSISATTTMPEKGR